MWEGGSYPDRHSEKHVLCSFEQSIMSSMHLQVVSLAVRRFLWEGREMEGGREGERGREGESGVKVEGRGEEGGGGDRYNKYLGL